MFTSYIKLAFRNLKKNVRHSLINIFGLALGLATFILIALYLNHELSYDKQHPQPDRTYRVINASDFNGVGETSTSSPCPLMKTMREEYSNQIETAGRVFNNWNSEYFIEHGENGFKESDFFFADSSILDIFKVEFVRGNPETSLRDPLTVLITESAAERYFGDENPVGKKLRYEERFTFTVTGVIADAPTNTHFHYDFLASMSSLRKFYRGKMPETWYWNPFWTYVVLKENVSPENLEKQFSGFVKKYFPVANSEHKRLYLQPLKDIHLNSQLDYEIETNAQMSHIIILSVIAVFMLVIACINFMNLSTASAAGRAKEIGIKKVLGGQKKSLVIQFLTESVFQAFLALIIALVLIDLVLPAFNNFTNRSFDTGTLFQPETALLLLLAGLVTGIAAGIYPALYLSGYRPVKVLKGNVSRGMRSAKARKMLVVIQFSIAIALIIGTSMALLQLNYIRNADLGFSKNNVVMIPISRTPVSSKYAEFEGELLQHPKIEYVTTTEYIPGTDHNNHEFKPEGYPDDEWQFYPTMIVREDFLKLFDIPLVAGRDYSRKNSRDKDDAILINEAMVEFMGWPDNQSAIGKKFHSLRGQERVVGVFRNFNVKSLHSQRKPFVLNMKESDRGIRYFAAWVAVKYLPGSEKEVLTFLEKKWKAFAPSRPFDYTFLEQEIEKLYSDEKKVSTLSGILTVMTIVIAVLGLFGLVSFMADQRTREIGIRRTLGASISHIIQIITGEFMWLVLIANLIAWPAAYLVLNDWLKSFAYHTGMNFWIYLLSGSIAAMLTLAITSVKAYNVSRLNPGTILKYE